MMSVSVPLAQHPVEMAPLAPVLVALVSPASSLVRVNRDRMSSVHVRLQQLMGHCPVSGLMEQVNSAPLSPEATGWLSHGPDDVAKLDHHPV